MTPFSLFDGDWVNRAFAAIGLRSRSARDIAGRCVLLAGVTWGVMAGLALWRNYYSTRIDAVNFFADYAAYMQFLIALPVFVVAERIVSRNTREAAADFLESGVVPESEAPAVDDVHREVARLRLWAAPEVMCLLFACMFALWTVEPEFAGARMATWHTRHTAGGWVIPTRPGAWAIFVALPILNYWWLRFAWKIVIWTRYLYRMSRLRLKLVATHPDLTGGIGFISEVQAKFALVLFAYGISNVVAVIAYKIKIEHASALAPPVLGPAIGFIVGAPILFTLPLLYFTKQLYRVKHHAKALWRERAFQQAAAFEAAWLGPETGEETRLKAAEVSGLNHVATAFKRVEEMRVVPFDLKSAAQLLAATAGSVATALPLLKLEGPLKDWLELLQALLKHGG